MCGQVVRISSQTGQGVPELWDTMLQFRDAMLSSGELQARRQTQQKVWLWNLIQENALRHFQQHPAVRTELPELERRVTCGDISPGLAADLLLKVFSDTLWWKALPWENYKPRCIGKEMIESCNLRFLIIVFHLVLKDLNNWWHLIIIVGEITIVHCPCIISVGKLYLKKKKLND